MVTVKVYLVFLALLACERLIELLLSRRIEAWARNRGGREFGRRHFGFMKVLHASFLLSCAGEVLLLTRPFHYVLGLSMFLVVLFAQFLRYWSVGTLGPYWNVRIIVVPGAAPVTDGPYRYVRHPNYLAVILEGFAIPLVHSAWMTAIIFTVLNSVLLATRIRCEERALRAHSAYDDQLGNLPRLLPTRGGLARR